MGRRRSIGTNRATARHRAPPRVTARHRAPARHLDGKTPWKGFVVETGRKKPIQAKDATLEPASVVGTESDPGVPRRVRNAGGL